jgi:hypothetical protein
MPTTEPTINDALAELLTSTRSLWRQGQVVRSENTNVLRSTGMRPDILVVEPNVSPVIIETELAPAMSVECDARQRLGQELVETGRTVFSCIAVRLPAELRDYSRQALKDALARMTDYDMAMFAGVDELTCTRWPTSGWLRGGLGDISLLAQSAAVPPQIVEQAAQALVDGVNAAAGRLVENEASHPGVVVQIGEHLKQAVSSPRQKLQTLRMAMTILANAFVFHETLAGGRDDLARVLTVAQLRSVGLTRTSLLNEWGKILQVDYWPVFNIAKTILETIPSDCCGELIEQLAATADQLLRHRLMRSHDLTGAVFQKLIADRKFLAAFYTHPSSAALLVGLALSSEGTPAGGLWERANDVTSLRVADLACGTGTLLSSAYRRIGQLHELAGGDAERLHATMMAEALIGYDVLPAAAHLTASMLAGAHPTAGQERSLIHTLEYGPVGGRVAIGSLDLLDAQAMLETIGIAARAQVLEGAGAREEDVGATLAHGSCDVVLMNPPFTRDTNHEATRSDAANPMFAAFGLSRQHQREMARVADRLLQGSCANGNAGEASAFLALADMKLKVGGTLALVMPLSLMAGDAWEASRRMLRGCYADLVIASIAGGRQNEMAFSADTGMGECLVVGRKVEGGSDRATFVVLGHRPSSEIVGSVAAQQIRQVRRAGVRQLEDGPVGGTPIRFGDEVVGFAVDAPLPRVGPWNLGRIADLALAQTAFQMASSGVLWLPGMNQDHRIALPMTRVETIGRVGPVHRDINGNTPTGGIRGPFTVEPLRPGSAPTYPVLWAHDANRERCMEFGADSEGVVRRGVSAQEESWVRAKAERIAATSSHCHFNADFQFNSQSTAMQYTSQVTIGGRAWPSIGLSNGDQEKVLTLWGNCSLGLLMHWWHANRQQAGRGNIGVSSLGALPILDVTRLTDEGVAASGAIFDGMKHLPLKPVNQILDDAVRQELDRRMCTEVLGLPADLVSEDGPIALLRRKLATEPSIHGGRSTCEVTREEEPEDDTAN